MVKLMLEPKIANRSKTKKGYFSGITNILRVAVQSLVGILPVKEVVAEDLRVKLPQTATVTEDADKLWIIKIFGNKEQALSYLNELKTATNLSYSQVKQSFEALLTTKELTIEDIKIFKPEDIKAIFEILRLGKLESTDACYVYGHLSNFLKERIACWLSSIYTEDLCLTKFSGPLSTGNESILRGKILRYYTLQSSQPISTKCTRRMTLVKIAIFLLTGICLPSNRVLVMCPIWFMLANDLISISMYSNTLSSPAIVFGIMIEAIAFLSKEELQATFEFIGNSLSNIWRATPKNVKDWINHRVGIALDVKESKKFLCWNKTLSVLTNKKSLTEGQASKMLATFTFGKTVVDSLQETLSLTVIVKRISPFPTRNSIYEIISFFRGIDEYVARKEMIYKSLEKKVANISDIKERLKLSYKAYVLLLKLEVAFIPDDYNKRISGSFAVPDNMGVNYKILNEIVEKCYIGGNNALLNLSKRIKYKSKLKNIILNNPTSDYLDFFGTPKNVFFTFGHELKYYSQSN